VRHRVEGSSGGRPSPAAARLHRRRSSGRGAGPAAAAQPTRGGAAAATLRAAPLAPSRADAWQGRPPRPQSASSRRRTRVTRTAVLLPVVGPSSWRRRTTATAATRASTTTAAAELTRLGGGWDGAGEAVGAWAPRHVGFPVSPRLLRIWRNPELTGFCRARWRTPLERFIREKNHGIRIAGVIPYASVGSLSSSNFTG
jgi:hypothetical protein